MPKIGYPQTENHRAISVIRKSKEVQFANGLITLAGTLHLPEGTGPHPAILFIHGDGGHTRTFLDYYRHLWEAFLAVGVACLSWDKPGVGTSTSPRGPYQHRQSFFERAVEIRKAMDLLKGQEEIDATRIGLWGISQAGWIMALVASMAPDVAFLIAISCPGMTGIEQSAYLRRHQMAQEGHSAEEIEEAMTQYAQERASYPYPTPSETFWHHIEGRHSDYASAPTATPEQDGSDRIDPRPLLEQVTCPVLAIFGEKDRNVPPTESARIFQEALGKAGNTEVTIKIFPQADHFLLQTKTGAIEEIDLHFERYCTERVAYPFVSGYIETMAAWLKDRIDIHP